MSLYQRKDSDVWWMNISIPGVPRVRKSTETNDKTKALAIHNKFWSEVYALRQKAGPIDKTWHDAVKMWLARADRSESDKLSLNRLRGLNTTPLEDLTSEKLVAALAFCETPGTFNRYRARIVAILNLAKRHKWIAEVPHIEMQRVRTAPRRWLTHTEWARLYPALPRHLKAPAMLAIQTGLRQANVFGLRWKDVDLARGHVVVEGGDAKSGVSLSVPLNAAALKAIAGQIGMHHEFVFTYRGRRMVKPKEGFAQALRDCGLTDFTWHGFRHTWATWHIQNGTPVDVLQKLGGWADLRMVMSYAHHSAGHLAKYAGNVTADVTNDVST